MYKEESPLVSSKIAFNALKDEGFQSQLVKFPVCLVVNETIHKQTCPYKTQSVDISAVVEEHNHHCVVVEAGGPYQ